MQALKHVFAVRLALGDPGTQINTSCCRFLDPSAMLTGLKSRDYLEEIQGLILANGTLEDRGQYGGSLGAYRPGDLEQAPRDHGTSGIAAMDGEGGAAAVTTSLTTGGR